ncbi:MAG: RNA polymerase sigma factor [bacterium]
MTKKINQKILLYRLQTKKDPDAFTELYDHYVKQIYRFVFFKVSRHEEAEDITSEVFLKAWHYISAGNKIESFTGLLYRLARNQIVDLYRNKSRHIEISLEQGMDMAEDRDMDTPNQLGQKMEIQKIRQSLKRLKQEYQEVITLRYIDELKIGEIAEIMGKGKVNVRVTLHRAIKKLKQISEDQA